MYSHVRLEIIRLATAVTAEFALERLFVGVYELVAAQVFKTCKSCVTDLAGMRLEARVRTHMLLQSAVLGTPVL